MDYNMEGCKIEQCILPPTYKCLCSNSEDKYCDKHIEEHLEIGENHKLVVCYFKIPRGEMLMHCRGCINKISAANHKIAQVLTDNIRKLTDNANDCIEFNRKMENTYYETVNYLDNGNDKIIKKLSYSQTEEFILKYLGNPDQISKDFCESQKSFLIDLDMNRKLKQLKNQLRKAKSDVNEQQNTDLTKMRQMLKYLKSMSSDEVYEDLFADFQSQYMSFFENNTKNLCVIDLISDKDTKTTMNIADILSWKNGFCELPNNQYLYYSSTEDGKCSDICYTFDIQNKKANKQKCHKAKSFIGTLCYLNNYVYSFGGHNSTGVICPDSERFNLLTGEWENIPPIKTACHWVSSISLNKLILISAYDLTKILEYNTETNFSSSYLDGSFVASHTILCKGLGGIFLFTQGSLWNIANYKKNKLIQINASTGIPNVYIISGPTRHGLNIYFILNNKQIWRFNLLTKEVLSLRKCNV